MDSKANISESKDSSTAKPTAARFALLFTVDDQTGALERSLRIFKDSGISLSHIESRPSRNFEWEYDFMVEFVISDIAKVTTVQALLEKVAKNVTVISKDPELSRETVAAIPWFPRKLVDLDGYASRTLEYGGELAADHPGFTDAVYRDRRANITAIARTFHTGQEIPRVEYTKEEVKTWGIVYERLVKLYPTHACREHQYVFPLLQQNCGYGPDKIPQLQDVSEFLRECTGFTLRPVMGLLSSRDFLNGLAFRVFHSTQYIRHHSKPFYTPEPDICHELLGHVPLFADPDFAAFSQEIGLCSLGASDADIKKLATIYWFTVEFGLCQQDGQLRAYGAGLLSSFGELEYCVGTEPETRPFDPAKVAIQSYPITQFQPLYFVAESFRNAQERVREFAATMDRSFSVRYNPFTQTIEVLDTREKILKFASSIHGDMSILMDALAKLGN
jgi:phenylalanine-4-hydroxylase